MKHIQTLLALALAGAMGSAAAAPNWVGTANYGVETVGPFSTYDLGTGAVLLESTGTAGSYNGYYQSFVTNHELFGTPVTSSLLNNSYELTMVASFAETVTTSGSLSSINVSGGTFNIYLDTASTNHNYTTDSGFTDGTAILTGTITGGSGAAVSSGSMVFGATDIDIKVTSFDSSVFNPATITDAGGIFTLRLNSPLDSAFLSGITKVQGNAYSAGAGDLLFAADGQIALAVPEADTYAMMLAGLGLVGFMARRRIS
jgi:hypothetical protein